MGDRSEIPTRGRFSHAELILELFREDDNTVSLKFQRYSAAHTYLESGLVYVMLNS